MHGTYDFDQSKIIKIFFHQQRLLYLFSVIDNN
jgi:hypothetical protein